MFRRLFSLEGKNRHLFVACDLRTESSERTGDEMVVTVEELKRLERSGDSGCGQSEEVREGNESH